jgi:hypothetical protein
MSNILGSKADKQNLQLYLRLILSYGDFKHSYRCAQYLLDQHDIYAKEGGDDLLLRALYSSLVVAYARPFNSYGSSRFGRVPALAKEIHEVLSAEELTVHDYILHCRNKLIAHTDAEAIDVTPFVATDLPNEMVVPSQLDALAPFTKEFTEVVLALTEKCWHWCVERRHSLEPLVKHLLERRAFVETTNNGS